MSEETWYKFLAVSMALHIIVLGAFSIPIKWGSSRKIDLSSAYSVNLVGSAGSLGGGSGGRKVAAESKPQPKPDKPAPAVKEKKTPPKKLQPIRKEDNAVSISKKKVPPRNKATREEVDRLEERIRNIRKKTDYIDVAKAGSGGSGRGTGSGIGLPGSGGGSGTPLDPAMQKYLLDVYEKIKNAWNVPGMAKKDLETIITIKVRKDGRITDIDIEKRSGNRIYDESILRVLRAVEPLPAIPSSLNTDSLEIGFRFLPGGIS
ncbi:MAG: TonB family protein [Syntrophorhabdaceae bacterium]|nr:TonB family protein [Syntrophorhabdaceae bacterium]